MEERKIVKLKKNEFGIKEYIKKSFGKGKISNVNIEYTPIGEKIIISTNRPGFVIGRKGEKIIKLTEILKKRFEMENPNIDINEVLKPEFDAQLIADEIAILLEKRGPLKFKVIAYRTLERIVKSGALGVELRLSGKLPSERAKTWRFASGYLKKTGDTAKIVDIASATAKTKIGVVGVKVSILSPDKKIHDQIKIDDETIKQIKQNIKENKLDENKEKDKKPSNKKK